MHDKMIFLHIPKSGGRTFHTILERYYPADRTFTIRVTKTRANNTQDFILMEPEARNQIDLLKGHLSFGLHELMAGKSKYVTFLRSPRERIVSFYYYVLMRKRHRLHQTIVDGNMSLYDFVVSMQRGDLHNCQIRFVSGIDDDEETMYAKAMKNIESHFSFVGVTEKYDESLVLLQEQFGWPTPHYLVENKTKNRPSIDQIDAKTLEAIDERNRGDQRLYEFAIKQLEEKIATCPEFHRKLLKLKRVNKLHSHPIAQYIKRRFL